MKTLLKIAIRVGRVITSRWFVIVLLLAVAISCICRGISPGVSKLEKLAGEIRDQKFQYWFATIKTEREKAGLRTALDTYSRTFGSSVWARHAASELDENGKPRFFDLAELAMSIESGEDRVEFAKAHADTYTLIVSSGSADLASAYAAHLRELRQAGGRDWRVARKSPLAVAVHAAAAGKPGLWTWYLDNRSWVNDFLVSLHADPDDEDPGAGLVDVLDELRRRPKVYRALRDEVARWVDKKDGVEEDLDAEEFLAVAMGTVATYGDMFEVLCTAQVPFGEALDVLANNIGDLNFGPEGGDFEACREPSRETGVELANLYRSHPAVWNAAAALGGGGAIRYFRDVPQFAGEVLTAFGDADVLPFLMEYYADSRDLLAVASEILVKYEVVGWSVLATFAGNDEFKRALLKKGVGHLVVPFIPVYVSKFGDSEKTFDENASEAVSKSLDDPGWVKRYLNPDGSFKPETETLAETLPFVGGIATVMKHQLRGEPVTMGEIGWATFDVVDDVVTVAALIGSGGTATPAVAAKQAAKASARNASKVTIKQSSKQIVKQSTTKGVKYVANKGGKVAIRNGVTATSKQEMKAIARHSLVRRVVETTGRIGSWTIRVSNRTVRLVASPVAKTAAAWRKLPPATRRTILRTAAAAMFFIAVTARTLPKLPEALHETLKRTGKQVGDIVDATVKGVADGFVEAVNATLGLQQSSVRPVNVVVGGVAFAVALVLFLRGRHSHALPPVRLA